MTPYDHAPPASPPRGEPASADPPALKRRSSNKRKRNHKTDTRWDDAEYAELLEKSQNAALSPNGLIRALVTGTPGPRARRRPHVDEQLYGDGLAELNSSANVLNQFLPYLHAGYSITLGRACAEALAANRRAAAAILEALGRKEPDDDNQREPAR